MTSDNIINDQFCSELASLFLTANGSNTGEGVSPGREEPWIENGSSLDPQVNIGTLPDDVYLEIFDFYVHNWLARANDWHTLAHVCRRWRSVVFASPRRLGLELLYRGNRPMAEMPGTWLVLPIQIQLLHDDLRTSKANNVLSALDSEHHVRVRGIRLFDIPSLLWERFSTAMQRQFPKLTHLDISLRDEARAIPDSFLGGSAPHLRSLHLTNTSFPAMNKLFLSASDLFQLVLSSMPDSSYISPEAMATCLSVLPRLEILHLQFCSLRSHPDMASRRPPPLTRAILPALTTLHFVGASEYIDHLMSRVDAPLLHNIFITFFNQLIFDTPHLFQFIRRTEKFKGYNDAFVAIGNHFVEVRLVPHTRTFDLGPFVLKIQCKGSDWQLSALAQVCSLSLPHGVTLGHLHIGDFAHMPDCWQNDIEKSQLLELLLPFTSLKNLYLTTRMASRITPILQGLVGQRVTDVLPSLQNIFLQGLEGIGHFVTARQLSDCPVTVFPWGGEADMW